MAPPMFTHSIATLLLFAGSPEALTDATPQPPQDAQMGDGLRLIEPSEDPDAPPSPAVTCADGETQKGIDISKWQGDVNWDAIAGDGVKFAFVRVSDGINTQDQFFDKNWEESRDAGVYTGVYQFFRPNQSVLGQADYLLEKMGCDMDARTCPITDMDLPPVIDVEHRPSGWSKTQMRNAVRTWIDRVEEFGLEPVVYTGRFFWQDYVDSDEWSDHPLWLAHYTNNCPNIPSHWGDWDFWQYTDSGSIAGVSGGTDTNQFNGTMAMLQALRPGGGDGGGGDDACGTISADDATIIDNGDACFDLAGPAQYWRDENAGHDGDLVWTRTTTGSEFNYGVWSLHFEAAGSYTVQVHVDPDHTTASAASYQVRSADGTSNASIDQRTGGWITLGTYAFDEGGNQHVRLSDKQGSSGKQLQLDAVRLVPEGVEVDGEDCGEAVNDGSGTSRIAGDRGAEQGCSVGGSRSRGGVFFAALMLLGLWSRRRRS